MSARLRVGLAVLVSLAELASSCVEADLVGRRCNREHGCAEGYLCFEERCRDASGLARCGDGVGCDEGLTCIDGYCLVLERDGGAPRDAGPVDDAGPRADAGPGGGDAGPSPDAGHAVDAGSSPDAGRVDDAGPPSDAGQVADAGPSSDAGQVVDAGPSSDGGPSQDAGPQDDDAGPQPDAGAGVFFEPFSVANGPWPSSRWSADALLDAQIAVAGNEGALTGGTSINSTARAIALHAGVADVELTFKVRFVNTEPAAVFKIYLRGSGAWHDERNPTDGYGLELGNGGIANLTTVEGGSSTSFYGVGQEPTWATSPGLAHWIRFRVEGDRITAKAWRDGTGEPAGYFIDETDDALTAPGVLMLLMQRNVGATKTVAVDDVRVTPL